MVAARVRLHVPAQMVGNAQELPWFYRNLLAQLAALGAVTEVLHREPEALASPAPEGHFDFIHLGREPRPLALNLGTAYLGGFFYVDPKGVYGESSVSDKDFNPAWVPADNAEAFLADLRRRLVLPRKSRARQPEEVQDFGSGHLALFLQDWSDPVERVQHMTCEEMTRAVIEGAGGRRVVVKPHPRNKGRETRAVLRYLRGCGGDVTVTDANVHDILHGAAASISISSSLALEGMLHRVPAILFGRSDLHHCATTVATPDQFSTALATALATNWPYARFLLWFLRWQNIDASRPFLTKVLDRMASQGADFTALGITRPPVRP
jgi:hypothetical protein